MAESKADVGSLIRANKLSRKDVEEAIARVFDGRSRLPLANGRALVMPALKDMTVYSREAIMTALLLAEAVEDAAPADAPLQEAVADHAAR
ncbi:MAG TPA: hypothetical protein VHG30_19490 [Microvirga sp.]|nr:hypothetical protein [Microvirga sp.]